MEQVNKLRQGCLIVLSAGLAAWGIFGLVLAFLNRAPFLAPLMQVFWTPFIGSASPDPVTRDMLDLVLGILGAIMASWAALMLSITWHPLRRGEPWAWTALFVGVVIWFLIDEFTSVRFAVWANAIGNVVLLVWFLVPLFVLRRTGRPSAG